MRFTPTKKISELEALTDATLDTTYVVGISGSTTYKISINQLTSSLDTTFASDLVTTALSNSLDTKLSTASFNESSASFHSRINAVSSSVSIGTSGTSGTSGLNGSSGTSGTTGTSGTSGTTGTSGTSALDGTSGVDGTSGTSGTAGGSGAQGPQGNQGLNGLNGTSGTTATYIGSSSDTIDLATLVTGSNKTLTTTTGLDYTIAQHVIVANSLTNHFHGDVVSYNDTTGELILDVTDINVASGIYSSWTTNLDGAAGGNGTSGTSGTNGVQGNQGPIGPQGVNGTAGSSGVQGNQGPQGNQGATGAGTQGVQGPIGPQGNQGVQGVDGSSAGYLKITQLLDNAVTTTRTGQTIVTEWTTSYTSQSGSTCLFDLTFSAFAINSAGNRQFDILIDSVVVKSVTMYFNETSSHKIINTIAAEQLSAGSHTIQIRIPANTQVDIGDYASMTVTETMSNGTQGVQGPQGNQGPQGVQGVQGSTLILTSYSGSVAITGSLTVSSATIISSSLVTNTSSLYLTSGSNMYVQNNGLVEITGSLKVKGTTRLETVGGDEGGEIEFGVPQTNTTLSTSVKADVYQNRFRIFDGNTNGVFIDLSKAPTGANGELMQKASGFVNAGDYVTLGNLKARIPTSGNRSVQVATVSGTYSVYGSNIYSQAGGIAGATLSSPLSITTTPTYLSAANSFSVAGATDTWIISDTVNFIAWRITIVIGPSFNANLITIERLH